MYTPNHAMLSIVPPNGTQLIGHVDGSYMFIFDRSLKNQVVDWLASLLLQAGEVSPLVLPVSSSGTSAAPVQGKVLKGDVTFEFSSTPAKLDETIHVDADVAEAMASANKRGQHNDTEKPPPPTEPNNEIPSLEA